MRWNRAWSWISELALICERQSQLLHLKASVWIQVLHHSVELAAIKRYSKVRIKCSFLCAAILSIPPACSMPAHGQSEKPAVCQVEDADVYFRPSCVVQIHHGHPFIKKKYLKYMTFNEYGLTALLVQSFGAMYVDHNGRVVVRDVALIDNGPDDFHHGLVRIMHDGQYGYADPSGRIVVPEKYPCAFNLTDEYTDIGPLVCVGCRTEKHGEYQACLDGTWFRADREGHLTPAKSPLDQANGDDPK